MAGTVTGERNVLVILPMGNGMAQSVLTGIRAEAAARRWRIFSVETERMADGSARIERSSKSAVSVGELASLVRPDGVIVWSYALSPEEVADKIGAMPTLFVNPPFDDAAAKRYKCGVVRGDAKAVASLAARELLFRDLADLIRLGACQEGFSPRAVVAHMGVSRSLAFDLFRRVAGHTILDEIQAVRLERAKELLAAGRRADLVASDCGFASHDDFRRVFRKRCGMSVKAWKAELSPTRLNANR